MAEKKDIISKEKYHNKGKIMRESQCRERKISQEKKDRKIRKTLNKG